MRECVYVSVRVCVCVCVCVSARARVCVCVCVHYMLRDQCRAKVCGSVQIGTLDGTAVFILFYFFIGIFVAVVCRLRLKWRQINLLVCCFLR